MKQIDLNSDMGEGFGRWSLGDDEALLDTVTSANVACGFHAGDPLSISATVSAAHANGVVIGAHVAYRDLVGFGRRFMDVSPEELTGDVIYQIGALKGIAASVGSQVRYVKPHGALYNTIAHDERQARAVIDAITRVDDSLVYMGLAGAPILGWAQEAGLRTVAEAFADRGYNPDGQLVSRRERGAVLDDEGVVASRMVQLATQGTIEAVDGSIIEIEADSICVHSDTPGAVAVARTLKAALQDAGVAVQPFVTEAG